METATITNPLHTISSSSASPFDNNINTMDSAGSPDFLKLEDLDNAGNFTTSTASQQATPPPVIVQSKPAKKRKSWGQQLPEPKTTLPPRKRAKTDDEKEQRRIERIKRNRAAAHNSRERKRQEAEVLAVENAQLRTKLEAFEKHFGPLPKHIVLPEVTLCTDDAATPAPSLIESRGSIAPATSPASPPDLYDLTNNDITIKQEPHDSPYSNYHHTFDALDGKQAMPTFAPLDETQHSAAMLCDLPCPSSSLPKVASPLLPPSNPTISLLLATLNTSFLTAYRTLLMAMWTHSRLPSSRPARAATSASARASTSPSTTSSTPTASRTHPRLPSATALAQRNAATAVARFAALRAPLVGEGIVRTAGLATVSTRRQLLQQSEDVTTMAFSGQDSGARDQGKGVGRRRDRDGESSSIR